MLNMCRLQSDIVYKVFIICHKVISSNSKVYKKPSFIIQYSKQIFICYIITYLKMVGVEYMRYVHIILNVEYHME